MLKTTLSLFLYCVLLFVLDEPRVRSGAWEEAATCDRKQQQQQVTPPPPLVQQHAQHHSHPAHHHASRSSRTLQHSISQRSSEDSWCSGSEGELSSDEESDRSAASSTRLAKIKDIIILSMV